MWKCHTKKENSGSCRRERSGPWHSNPQINCCIRASQETGLAERKARDKAGMWALGGAINSQKSESLQGRGCGEEVQWERKPSVIQSREVRAPSQCIELAGVRDHVFREEHEPPLYHLPTSLRNFHHTVHPHTTGLWEAALIPHFIPLGILEYEQ